MSWGIVATVGGSIVSGLIAGNNKGASAPAAAANPAYYDPYSAYRGQAASQLNNLMLNPMTYLDQTPEYQSMLTAAQRQAASQGYNGSGNALVAAANAGGQAYQQAFNNLATLSGAAQSPAQAGYLAASQGNYNQQMNQQMWGGLGSIFGRLGPGIASAFGGGGGSSAVIGDVPTWGG
jgi:hypothetical protein